jgi:hypothetical protein
MAEKLEKLVKVRLNMATLNPNFNLRELKFWYATNDEGELIKDELGNMIALPTDKTHIINDNLLEIGTELEISEQLAKVWENEIYDLGFKSYKKKVILQDGLEAIVERAPIGQLNDTQPVERHIVSRATRI